MGYIVRNCPAYWNQVYSCTRYTETACQNCSECLTKQIIKMLIIETKAKDNPFSITRKILAEELLSKYEIEGMEEK